LLVPIFEALCQQFSNIHLDVYSGFDIYGWPERDQQYQGLYTRIDAHPNMTYHGVQDNDTILKALEEAHVFLYPNIWRETSCIALIEAIKSQVICIHPNLGALAETACNATIMYDFNEDPQIHANYAFAITAQLLVAMQNDPNYLNKWTFSDRFALARNNIDSFTTIWNQTLRNVLDGTDD
jgi:UDP-glucose:(glucosyl)LPS alpha-1,2-glucosyltransferase